MEKRRARERKRECEREMREGIKRWEGETGKGRGGKEEGEGCLKTDINR